MGATIKATLAILILASSTVCTGPIAAQSYPTRPIRLIVAGAAGGPADISARSMANELALQVGQQIVVDNRPSAGGIIGWEMVARSAPDGYVIAYISNGFAANPSLYSKLPYDTHRDFTPIVHFASNANILTVNPSLPIRSVKELIEQARAKPGALSFGSVIGSSGHIAMELFKGMTNTNMVNVSYKGIQQGHTDAISGQIHVICDVVYTILPHIRSGRLRALGATALKRSPIAPEVPTIDEAGVPGYEITNWSAYSLPAHASRDIVLRLNTEINKALLSPSVQKSLADRGSSTIGGTPEQFSEFLRKEIEKWGKVIKAAGIKPQ